METSPTDAGTRKSTETAPSSLPLRSLLTRAGTGGALMGLANLVPGISGGTMLLASGIFPHFIQSVADLTRFRFNRQALLVLGTVAICAALVIGVLAGVVSSLVVAHTWIMYSLFIGLTLGGVPLIWKMAEKKPAVFWWGTAAGLVAMTAIAILQMLGAGTGGSGRDGFFLLVLAGVLGASAMVLPGISGGYLLLLLGVYVIILQAIEQIFTGIRTLDIAAVWEPVFGIALPVGLGLVLGIAGVSNLVRFVLTRFPNATLGLLLGLLLGAVAGLWPYQKAAEPEAGMLIKGQTVLVENGEFLYQETGRPVDPGDYPREFFRPSPTQAGGAVLLVGLGFAVTAAVARIGRHS